MRRIAETVIHHGLEHSLGVINHEITLISLVNHGNIVSVSIYKTIQLTCAVDSNPHRGGINSDCCHRLGPEQEEPHPMTRPAQGRKAQSRAAGSRQVRQSPLALLTSTPISCSWH